jgi:nucleotide-binding universal stress UspA family protein
LVIVLDDREVLEPYQILIDQDTEDALAFLQKTSNTRSETCRKAADRRLPMLIENKDILKAAIDIFADMIIMGSHSCQSLRDKLMGDTPASVTKRAPCPVLVVSHLPDNVAAA